MSGPTFPDGNGVRHVMLSASRSVTSRASWPRYLVTAECGQRFSVAVSEIDDNILADCMTCLVHQARRY